MRRFPVEQLSRNGVGCRRVRAEETAHPPEVATRLVARYRDDGKTESLAYGLGDGFGRDTRLRNGVDRGSGRGTFERQAYESRGVEAMHGRPAVGAVADVARVPLCARDRDERRDEAVVTLAVDRRGESYTRRSHTVLRQ